MRFRWGNIWTHVSGDEADIRYLQSLLTFPNKRTGVTQYMYDDRRNQLLSGLVDRVLPLLTRAGIDVEVVDRPQREVISTIDINPNLLDGATLREFQAQSLRKAIWAQRGILKLPTGAGKTIVSAAIAKYLDDHKDLSSLMIVPGVNSLNQSWARWRAYGLKDVGRLGDGHQDFGARHLIAVVNSAYSLFNSENPEAMEWSQNLGCVMWMEAHHAQAMMWAEIGKMADVPYRYGLTATPFVNGGDAETKEDYTILGITGNIIANVPDSLLMNLGIMAVPNIHFLRMGSKARFADTNWHSVKRHGIVANEPRNAAIVAMASRLAAAGRKVIILINEIEHCKIVARGVSKEIGSALVFHGGSKLLSFARGIERKSDKTEIQQLNQHLDELDSYVLIGSPAIDEDADFPSADTLIVGAGGRSPRRVVQRAGRVLRAKPGENRVDIIDFEDFSNVVLRSHSNSRKKTYLERYSGAKGFNVINHVSSDSVVEMVMGIGGGEGSNAVQEVPVWR